MGFEPTLIDLRQDSFDPSLTFNRWHGVFPEPQTTAGQLGRIEPEPTVGSPLECARNIGPLGREPYCSIQITGLRKKSMDTRSR